MGQGEELWVTFHGYGQSGEVMAHFMKHFRPEVKSVNFDLPHHGETKVYHESVSASELCDLLGHIMREQHSKRCTLLAFSLGGKVALKLMELMPGKIDRVILIAPDGLKINPLYRFTANTQAGKWLYGRVIENPNRLFFAAKMLAKSRLLNKKIEQFMHQQLDSRHKRELVYKVWRAFRFIVPDLKDIRSKIFRYDIRTTLVFGKHDRIIHPSLAKKLEDGPDGKVKVILLDKAHNLTSTQVAQELRSLLA
jgi:pimeloyl-ACP methyl ester carboxylesterase